MIDANLFKDDFVEIMWASGGKGSTAVVQVNEKILSPNRNIGGEIIESVTEKAFSLPVIPLFTPRTHPAFPWNQNGCHQKAHK